MRRREFIAGLGAGQAKRGAVYVQGIVLDQALGPLTAGAPAVLPRVRRPHNVPRVMNNTTVTSKTWK